MINLSTLDISRIDTDKIWAFCPFHKDVKKASLEICIEGKYAGKAYCWGCGYHEKIDIKELELFLGQKISIDCRGEIEVDFNEAQHYYKSNISIADILRIVKKYNLREEGALSDIGSGWGRKSEEYFTTIPMRNEFNKIIGIQKRFPDGFKCCMSGSKLGLFLHPDIEPRNPVIITEGWSDFITALDLGFFAIGRPSARYGKELVYNWLKRNLPDYKAIIVADNDEVGIETAKELQDYIDSEHTRSFLYVPEYKDFREEVKEKGKLAVIQSLDYLKDLIK